MIFEEYNNYKFLILSLIVIIQTLLLLNFRNQIAKYFKIFDVPNNRKIHKNPVPLLGGICFYSFLLILLTNNLINGHLLIAKFITLAVIYSVFFLVGLFDDIKTLSAKTRTIIIVFSALILLFFDKEFLLTELNFKTTELTIQLNQFSFIFTLFCIFSLYNALNFIDGYNGSATSIIIFWNLFLFFSNPSDIYLISTFVSVLIFFYNLSGKIFLGNSGTSLFAIFFSLSFISEHNSQFLFADEVLFLLLLPGLDMIRVTTERLKESKKIYNPDKTHLHHYLIKSNFKYIWQFIFLLTILPILILYLTDKIIFTLLINILIYISILMFLKKKDEK